MNERIDAARVRFFPPGIPLITIVVGVLLDRLWPLTDILFTISTPLRLLIGGGVVVGSIALLGFWSVLLFRRGGQNENPWKPTPRIETSGPFRVTRNPMYLQMVWVSIGVAIALANWWILFLTPVAAWALQELAIKPEEQYLEAKFGDEYLAYKRTVRRWL